MKYVYVCLVCVIVSSIGFGAHSWNSPIGDWNVAGNWWDGSGTTVPTSGDDVYLDGDRICNVPAAYTGQCNNLWGPAFDAYDFTLNVASGAGLDIAGNVQMANNAAASDGKFYSSGDVSVGGLFSVAYFGKGLLQVDDGTFDIGGNIEAAWNGLGGARINLYGGTMYANSIGFLRGNGYYDDGIIIDISEGTLVLRDAVTNLSDYWLGLWIEQGLIVGYGGMGEVQLVYEGNQATLTATPEPMTVSLLLAGGLFALRRRKK